MSNRFGLLGVKNAELLTGLSQLVQRGNELTAEVLAHLAELEERGLHLQLGYPSLFAYCVEVLALSEGSAGRRVAAARVCRRFPKAFELVARGDLHLSALCGVAPHLNLQNATELFTACCRKTRRQVDELLAVRFPRADVREQIRRLPVRGCAPSTTNDARVPALTNTPKEAVAQTTAAGQGHQATPMVATQISETSDFETAEVSANESPPPAPRARHREIEALSPDRFGVHFTADAELRELIERARALASHRLPRNDLPSLMRIVLESFVTHEEARRFGVGRTPKRSKTDATDATASPPRATPPGEALPIEAAPTEAPPTATPRGEASSTEGKTSPVGSRASQAAASFAKRGNLCRRSRCVSAAVRRAVYLRDGGRCSFVSQDARRCDARAMLELDHAKPWAKLGSAGADNIRLRCRAHNQLHARECFGVRRIEAKIAARRLARAATT